MIPHPVLVVRKKARILHRFEYRAPRLEQRLPDTLHVSISASDSGKCPHPCTCTSVGHEGLAVDTEAILEIGDRVTLEVSVGDWESSFSARVEYKKDARYGLSIVFKSEDQRNRIRQLLSLLLRQGAY